MQYTENLNLAKYETNDVTSYLEVANANMTKIDAGHGTLNAQVTANTSAIGDVQEDVDNMAPQVAESTTKANAGLSNTASVYDATQTYAVGDYVLYNNNLYRCITAITQAESFDGTKWERTTTTSEISKIDISLKSTKQDVTDINTRINANALTKTYEMVKNVEYVTPADGYFKIGFTTGYTAGEFTYGYINDQLMNEIEIASGSPNVYHNRSMYVKKGMRLKFDGSTHAGASFYSV